MIDSVLKGTGNSRFLKSAVPAGTSWADALAMLQAGTFPIDLNGINTEGFQQVGTPLNKANLLKDATAAQIGLPSSATPNDMFNALAHAGDLHVWRKTVKNAADVPAGYTLGDVQTGNFKFVADSYRTFEFGTPSVDDAGNVGLNVEGSVNGRYNSNFDNLKGKFCRPPDSTWYIDASLGSQVIYIPADATFSQSGSYKYVDKYQLVTGYPLTPAGTTTTYPVSTNRNAYQEGDDAKPAGYVVGGVKTGSFAITSKSSPGGVGTYWNDSAALSVSDDGTCTLATTGGTYIDGTTTNAATTAKNELQGKFAYCNNTDTDFASSVIVLFPSDTVFTKVGNIVYVDRYQPVTGYAAIPANTTIEYLGCLGDKARVQVVSYVGTGTYGSSNPNSLTFDFVPKMLFVVGDYTADSPGFLFATEKASYIHGPYSGQGRRPTFTTWNKTVKWYYDNDENQFNLSGKNYDAIAIG